MFDLSSLLRYNGDLVLITDRVAAPADFILLSLLGPALKLQNGAILISFTESMSHWSTIAARINPSISLPAYMTKGTFTFIDAQPGARDEPLKSIFEDISKAFEGNDCTKLVVLDGISALHWMGIPLVEILRFLRAAKALCLKNNASLVVRHHLTSPELDELLRFILSQSAMHVEVMPLSSGRSGSVSGEVAVHKGPLLCGTVDLKTGRQNATQYRLSDTGPFYFGRGTSAGVL